MGAKRKQRISKRILNEAKAEELRRRREQCEEMAMMGVCWTFAEANGFGDEVGNFKVTRGCDDVWQYFVFVGNCLKDGW